MHDPVTQVSAVEQVAPGQSRHEPPQSIPVSAPSRIAFAHDSGTFVALVGSKPIRPQPITSRNARRRTLSSLLRPRCRLDLEVVDAHLRAHSIDIAACNRVAW